MIILIPAYEPDIKFITLVKTIFNEYRCQILVVDDGSGEKYQDIFLEAKLLGCIVLSYPINKGKGFALKTGFKYILDNNITESIICADCDGQHTLSDILKVEVALQGEKNSIVLGARNFIGNVPFRSLFGNKITKGVFLLSTGIKINDTQTGLRGFHPNMLKWLCSIQGDRFEYELNMLLEAKSAGYTFKEVDIETIYLEENKTSHFRPVMDSIKIYLPIIMFSISSLSAGVLDFVLLFMIHHFIDNLFISVVFARICSSIFNYCTNKYFVFNTHNNQKAIKSAPKYFALVLVILACNYSLICFLSNVICLPLVFSKLLTEMVLFILSFTVQKKFVFK